MPIETGKLYNASLLLPDGNGKKLSIQAHWCEIATCNGHQVVTSMKCLLPDVVFHSM